MLFKLKEISVLTKDTVDAIKDQLKMAGMNSELINKRNVRNNTNVKYYWAVSDDGSVTVFLNKDGDPIATSKSYPSDHLWGESDNEAYLTVANGSEPNFSYLTAGFPDVTGHSSIWLHTNFEKMKIEEVNFDSSFHTFRMIQNRAPVEAAKKELIDSIGSAAPLIKEALKDVDMDARDKADVDGLDDELDYTRVRSKKTPRPLGTMSFMHKDTNYTMHDYVSVIKRECRDSDWKLLERFINVDPDVARVLGDLQKRFHFCEILFEDNKKFTEAYNRVNGGDMNADAVEIKKYAAADQVGARLPQAFDKRGLFLAINHSAREGELKPYVNLYDEKRKMYYTSPPTQSVPYAYALSRATECFTAFALERDSSCKDLVPKTQSLRNAYTLHDFSIMADVTVTSRKQRKGSISVIFNSAGGRVHGDMGKEKVCDIGPLARIMGEGIPAPYKLQAAYQHDEEFRDYWDNCVKKSVLARQKDGMKNHEKWHVYVELFHGSVIMERGKIIYTEPDMEGTMTEHDYHNTLNEAHESNREIIKTFSVDRSNFITHYQRLGAYPNEMMPITMANDLLFDGMDLELYDAGDVVNVGHLMHVMGSRMPTWKGDNVTFDDKWRDKFSIRPYGKKALIDMRLVHKREVFIGGGTFIEKITEKKNETRAGIYYDYEPYESVDVGGGVRSYTIEQNESSEQFRHAVRLCQRHMEGDYEQVACVVPLRALPYFIKTYSVLFVYPAPFPAVMSAYVVINKNIKSTISFSNICAMMLMMYAKVVYIFGIMQHGFADLVKVLDYQIDLESNDLFVDFFAAWYLKMVKRYRKGQEECTRIVIDDRMDKMLIVDKAYETKGRIKRGKQRADYNYANFGIRPKKRAGYLDGK